MLRESRPSSLFKDHVLFLITMVMRTGSVVRFFSFAKYTDTNQRHALHDNGRRLAFMTHYNGDLEGRLDYAESSSSAHCIPCYVHLLCASTTQLAEFGTYGKHQTKN